MGTHCPWCPQVLESLQALLAEGAIASLEAVNVEENPELAAELNIRTVPWVRIGPFELEGMRSTTEFREWAEKVGTEAGMAAWLGDLLSSARIHHAVMLLREDPAAIHALLRLFTSPDTPLNTRIGISVIMEELAGSERLTGIVDRLGQLTRHADASIRGDACHYLELSGDSKALDYIRPLLEDPDAHVREVARESLESLGEAPG
jgi:thiol-disulfide isomerase/thioredoxin